MTGASAFETLADAYDAWFDAHPALYESELQAVRAVLPEKTGVWVEIGVGTGRFASRLGIETGIEPAAAMAELARVAAFAFSRARPRTSLSMTRACGLRSSSPPSASSATSIGRFPRFDASSCVAARSWSPSCRARVRSAAESWEMAGAPFFREARLSSAAGVLAAMTSAGFRVERIV